MMTIEKPETDQVCLWHLLVRHCVWQVCCSVQSVSVQSVSDLKSKLPEYMTPADARKEAEVIKQQVKYVFLWMYKYTPQACKYSVAHKYTFHVIHIPHCIIHVCIVIRIHIVHLTGHLAYYSGLIQCSSHFKSIDTFSFFYSAFSSSLRMVHLLHWEACRLVMSLPVTWIHCSQNTVSWFTQHACMLLLPVCFLQCCRKWNVDMYLSVVFIGCSCCSFNPCKLPASSCGCWVLFKANCLSFCGSFWSVRFVYSTRNKFYLIGCFSLHTKFVCSIISVLCLQTLFVLLMCTNNCVSNLCCINWLTGGYQLLVLGNVVILFTKVQISNCL